MSITYLRQVEIEILKKNLISNVTILFNIKIFSFGDFDLQITTKSEVVCMQY